MDNNSFTDSRRHLRYDIMDFAMIYGASHPQGVRALVVDLGLGGIAIRSREALEADEKIRIQIGKSGGTPYELNGQVRYCDNGQSNPLYSIGIQFEPANHEEKISIARLINEAFQRSCKQNSA